MMRRVGVTEEETSKIEKRSETDKAKSGKTEANKTMKKDGDKECKKEK